MPEALPRGSQGVGRHEGGVHLLPVQSRLSAYQSACAFSSLHGDNVLHCTTCVCPAEGYIRLYRFKDSGRQLELVHRTATGGIPGALTGLKGKLLAGIGSTLRVYDAGRKKLLRKCEHRKLPTHIMTLATSGDRIYVGDQQVLTTRPSTPIP